MILIVLLTLLITANRVIGGVIAIAVVVDVVAVVGVVLVVGGVGDAVVSAYAASAAVG